MHLHRPGLLQVCLLEFPQLARVRDTTCDVCTDDLLRVTQKTDLCHVVRDVFALDLDQCHARVLRPTGMLAVTEVTEPCCGSAAPYLLDARVAVVCCYSSAGDGRPLLSLEVLERDLNFFVLFQVVKLLRVVVAEEEEVGTVAAGESHGAADRAWVLVSLELRWIRLEERESIEANVPTPLRYVFSMQIFLPSTIS
jgi:hypothetical protein